MDITIIFEDVIISLYSKNEVNNVQLSSIVD